MKKNALRPVLASLVIGGVLSAAAPANATLWLDFQDERYLLFGNLSEGTGGDVLFAPRHHVARQT